MLFQKVDNHVLVLGLYFIHYNFAQPCKSLSNPYPGTPAMAAGLTNRIWAIGGIVSLVNQSPDFDKITIRVECHIEFFLRTIDDKILVFLQELADSFHWTRTELRPHWVAV